MGKLSKFLGLNVADIAKSVIMAFMGSFVSGLYKFIELGTSPSAWPEWKPVVMGGVAAALGYLIKNFFTNSEGQFLKQDK